MTIQVRNSSITIDWQSHGFLAPLSVGPMNKGGHRPTRPLAGWAMTWATLAPGGELVPAVDRDEQVMEAAAELGNVDWSEYIARGLWNDTHTPTMVGVPTYLEYVSDPEHQLAKTHRKLGYFTGGHLWDSADPNSWLLYAPARPGVDGLVPANGPQLTPTPKELRTADRYWELAKSMRETGRPLGFSVQGSMAVSPCGKRILKAWVRQNAVCELPSNPYSTAEAVMAKGGSFPDELRRIRKGQVGASACGACRCPAGYCSEALGKSSAGTSSYTGSTGLSTGGVHVSGRTLLGVDLDEHRERVIQLMMQRWHMDREAATSYLDAAMKRLTSPDSQESEA